MIPCSSAAGQLGVIRVVSHPAGPPANVRNAAFSTEPMLPRTPTLCANR